MSTRSLVSPEISKRFDVLRTLLVVFVVGVHAEKGLQAYYKEIPDALRAVLIIVPHNIFRICVPVFFGISGYLFYLTYKPSAAAYGRMVLKKTRTILLPYLLFNALTIALILIFNKAPYMGDIHGLRQEGILKYLLGVYRFPAVYPLWFLRDLYVYFLLAPVFYVVSVEIPRLGVLAFWAVWMFVPQQGLAVELSGAFFFYTGCLLARTGADLDGLRRYALPGVALGLIALFAVSYVEYFQGYPPYYHLFYRHDMIFGTLALWLLTGYSWLGRSKFLLALSGTSFFVYLTHEPVLSYLIYGTRYIFHPTSGTWVGIGYMALLTALTFTLCTLLAKLLIRYAPAVYAVATGSRQK
jgi:surface polysaccharide O-acyltransferase-like enzyme